MRSCSDRRSRITNEDFGKGSRGLYLFIEKFMPIYIAGIMKEREITVWMMDRRCTAART